MVPWHESQVADVKTATSQGASGRAKSARSNCDGTVQVAWVGASATRRRSMTSAITTATATRTAATTRRSICLTDRDADDRREADAEHAIGIPFGDHRAVGFH